MCTKLGLHRGWTREEGNFEDLNEDEKSDRILKNLEVPKIAGIVQNLGKS